MSTVRVGVFALTLLAAGAASAQGGPNPYLGQAKVFYQGLNFEKCLTRLDQASKWKTSSPKELTEIELYAGLCQFNLGNAEEAETRFRAALKANPEAALPPYTSPKIKALFYKLKGEVAPAPPPDDATKTAAASPADAPKKTELAPAASSDTPAAVEGLQAEAKGSRRLIAPIALGGVAVIAAGAGTVMGLQAKALEQQSHQAHFESDAITLGQSAQQRATFANVGFAVAGAAVTGAVVTWLLSGDDAPASGAGGPAPSR